MDDATVLAALATAELVVAQIVDGSVAGTLEKRARLDVIFADVDARDVCLELAVILAGVVTGTGFPIGDLIEEKRRQLMVS